MASQSLEELEAAVGPLPGLAAVLRVAGSALVVEEIVALLTTSRPAFAGCTGVELLKAGDIAPVVALVNYVATPADLGAPPAIGSLSSSH
jgi:hypothetical protein